ncbi:retinol dehydrogenase 8-like [Diadema setosum]|uniref:retinol dehydrogenase 8-like n=1 Tax=Diadema setosum TaxID=31175 RepID=UPI003B3B404A
MAAKVTLVTGCSTGIGLSIAARLARDPAKGYLVYASMRNLKKKDELLEAAGDSLNKTLFLQELDVRNLASVKGAVKRVIEDHGRIDTLVNNAGIAGFNALEYMEYEEIQDIIDTNFMGSLRMIKETIPYMKKRRAGRILNVSSLVGLLGYPFYEVYTASKHAMEGLTDALASRFYEFDIRISSLILGPVTTMINENIKNLGRLPSTEHADDVTNRQLKLLSKYQKYRFEHGVAQSPEDMARCVQECLETVDPPLWAMTGKFCRDRVAYRYADPTGMKWVHHQRQLVEPPGMDIDELRRQEKAEALESD